MKYIIDTENGTCVPYKSENKITLADLFSNFRGAKEYSGIVERIQRWYYGSLVKASWCATSLSFFADQLHILDQIGGKNENVYAMMNACKKTHPERCHGVEKGIRVDFDIKKGDILFWLWDGNVMNSTSPKHVNVAEYDANSSEAIFAIGGNQKDKICTLLYDRDCLYMVFRPDYK